MSVHAPQKLPAKPDSPVFTFLCLTAMAICIDGAALGVGTEPRIAIKPTGERVFQVTDSNHFAGTQFYQKTIDGLTGVVQDDAYRDRGMTSLTKNANTWNSKAPTGGSRGTGNRTRL